MNFKLLSNTKKTSEYIRKIIINYPNKEHILKNNIDILLYKMIELLFYYNVNYKNSIKEKYLYDYLVCLSLLDYYILISYENKFLSKKKYESVSNYILELRKMSYGVLNSVKC